MQLEDMLPNYFTFNGKSYPATETLKAKVGGRILVRLIGSGQFIHPIRSLRPTATRCRHRPGSPRTPGWSARASATTLSDRAQQGQVAPSLPYQSPRDE
jgi:hypothetical protein